ncbi:hypothetical protein [Rhodococcus sp. 14-2496-1d]|uniref:hypothetical protein n=1 Tax=Rhodococcus sp. 14-2496-1d TaxID=2023146 RepID=UPI0015C652D9|nr:hypothetical protein [Rhodococcus sp. 14-2496-1d]
MVVSEKIGAALDVARKQSKTFPGPYTITLTPTLLIKLNAVRTGSNSSPPGSDRATVSGLSGDIIGSPSGAVSPVAATCPSSIIVLMTLRTFSLVSSSPILFETATPLAPACVK